jgi:hypothetical protein
MVASTNIDQPKLYVVPVVSDPKDIDNFRSQKSRFCRLDDLLPESNMAYWNIHIIIDIICRWLNVINHH